MFENFKKSLFLKNDLKELENYLNDFVLDFDGIFREALSNTLLAGGKRIRPALFLICAKNERYDIKKLIPAAAAIEFLHTASLIHDDIIDKSLIRRGKKTIHNIYDKDTARYAGDCLFTYAFFILNTYKNYNILREMSDTSQLLVIGEFDQIKTKKILGQNEEMYMSKINEKTSSLFKLSCVLGGILSGSSNDDIENMRKFGGFLGIAFQINDDLIDININKPKEKLDKPIGNDLMQGNITLPLIYALKDRKYKERIEDLIGDGMSIDNNKADTIISMIYKTDAINMSRQKIRYYLNEAKKVIKQINGSERKNGLIEICDFLLNTIEKAK
ncbi:MAG: polyprenyl synthetase family protein [Candidatus Humimicrobiaceae bacterium]